MTITSASSRSKENTRWSGSLLIEPVRPSSPLAAPSTVETMLTRSHGVRGGAYTSRRSPSGPSRVLIWSLPLREAIWVGDDPPHHPVLDAVRVVGIVHQSRFGALQEGAEPGQAAGVAHEELLAQREVEGPQRDRVGRTQGGLDGGVVRDGAFIDVPRRRVVAARRAVGDDEVRRRGLTRLAR